MAYLTNFERLAMLRDARELVIDALEEKFGVVPEGFQTKLQEIQEREVLRGLLRQTFNYGRKATFPLFMRVSAVWFHSRADCKQKGGFRAEPPVWLSRHVRA